MPELSSPSMSTISTSRLRSTANYFGAEPTKVKPGYANFAIADPPLSWS
ncbi:hypothetical protein MAUB1S_02943 [Mycolicibacterium aubagnense]